jgi:hypothetical protein
LLGLFREFIFNRWRTDANHVLPENDMNYRPRYGATAVLGLAAIALAANVATATAHELHANTARITLRDGHLDIAAEVDLFALTNQSATQIATASELDLASYITALKSRLQREMVLVVDGVTVPLLLRGFPGSSEMRGLAAELSSINTEHGMLVRLEFESPTDANQAQMIALQLPAALGPTLMSFVQPASSYATAGAMSSFMVHSQSRNTSPWREAVATTGMPWLFAVVGLGGLAALAMLGMRRGRGRDSLAAVSSLVLMLGCQSTTSRGSADASGRFKADVWADNWFAMYANETLVGEDSVPIITEKSFNAETFRFAATYPFELNLVIKDYKQNDTGLEYIGTAMQQRGDGGFITQIVDTQTGNVVAVSSSAMRCMVIHKAPLNPSCEKDANPGSTCLSHIIDEPAGWKTTAATVGTWQTATVYTEAEIGVKGGYNDIAWATSAKLIWSSDLKADNTLLCKLTITGP